MQRTRAFLAFALLAPGCDPERVRGDSDQARRGDSCDGDADCNDGLTCFEETCVGEGPMRVSVAWDRRTDLDLHIISPDGTELSWEGPATELAELDVDACAIACDSLVGPYVESAHWISEPLQGDYEIWLENFDGRRGTDWKLEVRVNSQVTQTWAGHLGRLIGIRSEIMRAQWP